ncbi:hypothetical protein [Micromonospora sp. L5]|uniref:hypothetical protein n=1 Tax=Micromonospora sp. (strain L5) TaxID=648999 RepID=UPI0001C45C8E|nr:hypothetical protein [Micromonospora sp. L5]
MSAPKLYGRSIKVPVTEETWTRVELVAAMRGRGMQEAKRVVIEAGLASLLGESTDNTRSER